MFEALKNFEKASQQLTPAVLLIAGLVLLGPGLCVWLGGLRFNRTVAGVLGAIAGASTGLFFIEHQVVASFTLAMICTLLAMFLKRTTVIIIGAVFVALIAMAVFAAAQLRDGNYTPQDQNRDNETLSLSQSLDVVRSYLLSFTQGIKEAISKAGSTGFTVSIVIGIIFLVLGLFLTRFIIAVTCSSLGTLMIFAGMILLLLYKGSAPVTLIHQKMTFYNLVLFVMIAFGTFAGLVLCEKPKPQTETDEDKSGGKK